MNKLLVIALFYLGSCSSVLAQWDLIFENDSLLVITADLHFFDENTGYVIGRTYALSQGSYILKTEDGGISWDTTFYQNEQFKAIHFPSRDTGYVSFSTGSQLGVMRTVDGGQNWEIIANNVIGGNPIDLPVEFFDNNMGVLSSGGFSFKTEDAGVTWTELTGNINDGEKYIAISNSTIVGAEGSFIKYSFDYAETFDLNILYENISGTGVDVWDNRIIIAGLGQGGTFNGFPYFNYGVVTTGYLSTLDLSIKAFPYIHAVRDVAVTENGSFYAVTRPSYTPNAYFLKSEDGGESWFTQGTTQEGGVPVAWVQRIHCANDTVCFAIASGRVYRTTNGGGPLLEEIEQVTVLSTNEVDKGEMLSISPNPSNGIFTVNSQDVIEEIRVYDISGKLVLQRQGMNSFVELNLTEFENGMYVVSVKSGDKLRMGKVVKQ